MDDINVTGFLYFEQHDEAEESENSRRNEIIDNSGTVLFLVVAVGIGGKFMHTWSA